jgi:hypothetical protein
LLCSGGDRHDGHRTDSQHATSRSQHLVLLGPNLTRVEWNAPVLPTRLLTCLPAYLPATITSY